MMKSQALLLILLIAAAAAAAAASDADSAHTASSALRGRRKTGSVVTVDDRERGDGNMVSGGTIANTTTEDVQDDRVRGDGYTGTGADATESEDPELVTRFPTPSIAEHTVVNPEPAPSPPQQQPQMTTPLPTTSTQTSLTVVTPDVSTPSPTPDSTMPKLFPDDIADTSNGTTEGDESFFCSIPFLGAICDVDLCAAPVVDRICKYFGVGGEEEEEEPSVAGDTGAGDEVSMGSPTSSPSTVPSVPPTSFPTVEPTFVEETPHPSASPSESPSETPSAGPITSSLTASSSQAPISSPTASPSQAPTSAPTEILECPVDDWDPYTIPELESTTTTGYIFNYTQESYELDENNQIHRAYLVRDNCVYVELTSEGGETLFGRPEEWLDAAAVHYGGAPYANGASFSGTAAPHKGDIHLVRSGVQEWSVMIWATSDSVVGDKPLTWIDLPSEKRANDFRAFLWTILEMNPQVLLSNDSNRCGSGPFCATVGPDACYMDPITGRLHVDFRMDQSDIHTAEFTDAMQWFGACAATINCFPRPGGGQFLYPAQPKVAKVDEVFSFYGADTVSGGPLEWGCGHERQSYKLYHMARAAARDPRSPFAVGGSA